MNKGGVLKVGVTGCKVGVTGLNPGSRVRASRVEFVLVSFISV